MPVTTVLAMMFLTISLPLYMLPVLVGPILGLLAGVAGSSAGPWLNLGVSLVVLAGAVGGHLLTLKPLGRLLWEREQRILDIVTAEVE
jgi:hypothetical protein